MPPLATLDSAAMPADNRGSEITCPEQRGLTVNIDFRPPGGNITWLAAIWFVIGCGMAWVFAQGLPPTWSWFSIGVAMVVVSIGLWFRVRSARWAAFGIAAILLALRLSGIARHGASLSTWLRLLVNVWYFWALWEWDVRKDEDMGEHMGEEEQDEKRDMVSLVQLLREPRYLDSQILANLASKAWGKTLTSGESDSQESVVGESPMFMASCGGMYFAINNFARPYIEDAAEAAASTSDMRISEPLAHHQAWLSVDEIMGADDPQSTSRAYGYIGKLLAELLDENCLAVLCPATGRVYPIEPELESKLRAADPLAALDAQTLIPVIRVADNDPRMQAAVAEARRRWPEFAAAWESREDKGRFAVKVAISDDEHTECMWLIVTAVENDIVYGRLDNEPLNVRGVVCGDLRRVAASEIWDWIYFDGSEMRGGFSLAVLGEKAVESDD